MFVYILFSMNGSQALFLTCRACVAHSRTNTPTFSTSLQPPSHPHPARRQTNISYNRKQQCTMRAADRSVRVEGDRGWEVCGWLTVLCRRPEQHKREIVTVGRSVVMVLQLKRIKTCDCTRCSIQSGRFLCWGLQSPAKYMWTLDAVSIPRSGLK